MDKVSGIGHLAKCKRNNSGKVITFWKIWFIPKHYFLFLKNVYYTYIEHSGDFYVISRDHKPIKMDRKTFKKLFKVVK